VAEDKDKGIHLEQVDLFKVSIWMIFSNNSLVIELVVFRHMSKEQELK